MVSAQAFRSQERVHASIDLLASFADACQYDDLPVSVQERLPLLLTDLAGVTVAGMRTPELRALVARWSCPPGDTPLPGISVETTPETSAYLAAVASCCLELDEGNKYAAGHPAAHVVFAAVAAAQLADRPVSGKQLLTAIALGYEVAARFGHATRLLEEWHPHGHWGGTGAACAAALVSGATPRQVAAAIDASTNLMQVTPWASVLDGDFSRNLWIAGANQAGLNAMRLALAGLVHNRGGAQHSLGSLLGTLDPDTLVHGLGERWLAAHGYVKQHSACSYTHTAVDLVQALRIARPWHLNEIREVRVRTHSLAAPLLGRHPKNRLTAMFSLPFVVSSAVVNARVSPETMEPGSAPFVAAEAFSEHVHTEIDEAFDRYLPELRCTQVRIDFEDGDFIELAAPNPVGDVDHFPFTAPQIRDKLTLLIGAEDTARIVGAVAELVTAPDACPILRRIALAPPPTTPR